MPPFAASRGRYWFESAYIAATETPFSEKKLVALRPVWCSRLSCGVSVGRGIFLV